MASENKNLIPQAFGLCSAGTHTRIICLVNAACLSGWSIQEVRSSRNFSPNKLRIVAAIRPEFSQARRGYVGTSKKKERSWLFQPVAKTKSIACGGTGIGEPIEG